MKDGLKEGRMEGSKDGRKVDRQDDEVGERDELETKERECKKETNKNGF